MLGRYSNKASTHANIFFHTFHKKGTVQHTEGEESPEPSSSGFASVFFSDAFESSFDDVLETVNLSTICLNFGYINFFIYLILQSLIIEFVLKIKPAPDILRYTLEESLILPNMQGCHDGYMNICQPHACRHSGSQKTGQQ
jgi:hypothetical protein